MFQVYVRGGGLVCLYFQTTACWGSENHTGYANGDGETARFQNIIGKKHIDLDLAHNM